MEAIKKKYPIRDENNQPSTYPTFASQVFFGDGSVLEGKEFGAQINDDTISESTTYSSEKIEAEFTRLNQPIETTYIEMITTYLDVGSGYCLRMGRYVFLSFSCHVAAVIPTGGALFTIPEGCRPILDFHAIAGGTNKSSNAINVYANGQITNSGSPIAADQWLNIGLMYFREESDT